MLNLDTHVLVLALLGGLTAPEQRLLSGDSWSVSAIVLWELAKLTQLGWIEMDLDSTEFTRALGRIHVWPLDLVAEISVRPDLKTACSRARFRKVSEPRP